MTSIDLIGFPFASGALAQLRGRLEQRQAITWIPGKFAVRSEDAQAQIVRDGTQP
jgi:hypothetical protein